MLSVRIIPCLDVHGGRVVKGVKFEELRDAGDPVAVAAAYEKQGADELVFLDITASSDERKTMVDVVERTADQVFMPLTVGGGLRSVEDIRTMLNAGADKVSLNTSAVKDPNLVLAAARKFGRWPSTPSRSHRASGKSLPMVAVTPRASMPSPGLARCIALARARSYSPVWIVTVRPLAMMSR